ncbi:hypothetical protein OG730_04425 [Streptomyces sp. NBC_01298]|uniref:hypothetical protein n=1 Tax=Streptomyces sp. NBC_01298 TaxID=2903817 RepID=UPI002E15DF71|nr:hypothetical protein OG730_04425 [Streptomyces sp. NBC_01298]
MTDADQPAIPVPAPRRRLPIALGIVAGVVLAGQTAALVVQQQQISDLRARAAVPGPRGPAGVQGPAGPQGPVGPVGKAGRDGQDGKSAASDLGTGQGQASGMTQLSARAYCTEQSVKAWPDGTPSGDEMLDQLGSAYTATQREKAFKQCMQDEGWPQP